MNLYLIEDIASKAAHLPSFVAQVSQELRLPFVIPTDWETPTETSKHPQKIAAALRDRGGLVLLDLAMDSQDYKDAAAQLLAEFPKARGLFLEYRERIFSSEDMFDLAAAVWAVGKTLESRIVTCTTAYGLPNANVWRNLNGHEMLRHTINWPTKADPYTWPTIDFAVIRAVVQQHWRKEYDIAAQAWSMLSSEAGKLFPHGKMHPAAAHVNPVVNAASANRAKELIVQFLTTAQINMGIALSAKEDIYFAKGASYDNALSLAAVCKVLNVSGNTVDPQLALTITKAGASAGAVLRAFAMLQQSETRCGKRCVWTVRVNNSGAFSSCACSGRTELLTQVEAADAARKLSRSPAEQMNEEHRPAPGMTTLALDYLPAKIGVRGTCVTIDMQFNIAQLP